MWQMLATQERSCPQIMARNYFYFPEIIGLMRIMSLGGSCKMVDLFIRPNQFNKYKVLVKETWFGVHIEFYLEDYPSHVLSEILRQKFQSMVVEMASLLHSQKSHNLH
jgi:hypothetical protein